MKGVAKDLSVKGQGCGKPQLFLFLDMFSQ